MRKVQGEIRWHQTCILEAVRLEQTRLILADLGQMPALPGVVAGSRLDPLSILDGESLPSQLICGVDRTDCLSDQIEQAELMLLTICAELDHRADMSGERPRLLVVVYGDCETSLPTFKTFLKYMREMTSEDTTFVLWGSVSDKKQGAVQATPLAFRVEAANQAAACAA